MSFFHGLPPFFFSFLGRIFAILPSMLRRVFVFLFFMMLLQAFFELSGIILFTYMGQALGSPDAVKNIPVIQLILRSSHSLQEWTNSAPTHFLIFMSAVVSICMILKNMVSMAVGRLTARTAEATSLHVAREIMLRYLSSEYVWHLSKESGQVFQKLLWRGYLSSLLVVTLSMYTGIITVSVLFGGLFLESPALSSVIIVSSALVGTWTYLAVKHKTEEAGKTEAAANEAENDVIFKSTNGIREILLYNQQQAFLNALTAQMQRGAPSKAFLAVAPSIPSSCLESWGFFLIVMTISLMSYRDMPLDAIASAVILLGLTAWRILPYLNRAVGQMVAIRGLSPLALPVLEQLEDLMRHKTILPAPPNSDFSFANNISLNKVSFKYPQGTYTALNETSLTIHKGEHIGIIGPSGAGKSTIAYILSGLILPVEGQILVDGEPLAEGRLTAYRKTVGFVAQSPFIMGGTLAENIAFSRWAEPVNMEKVHNTCHRAAIDFIDKHPDGPMMHIGNQGQGLSGGQAQRVSIARALYADPQVLIFDEATSALDIGNERLIQNTIQALGRQITCIIIAHRLSTVEQCDRIIWMEGGRIVKEGPPEEILPDYAKAQYAKVTTGEKTG